MVEDTKMKEEAEQKKGVSTKEIKEVVVVPPLTAAALRLEKMLSDTALDFYTNPAKVVRRWLGTSSGAAASASTAADISAAAASLLAPDSCPGRELLVVVTSGSAPTAMDTDDEVGDKKEEEKVYLKAAAQQVESWLISLAVRLLWREEKFQEALHLSQRGIEIASAYLEDGTTKQSLFPLLARLFRLRALVAESVPQIVVSLASDHAKAHNLATLRRDVDTQATLMNCMLRDLLRHKQGKKHDVWLRYRVTIIFSFPEN
jgi:hypothetical protein